MDVKPLFPRIGGKSRLSNWIINQLKERDFSIFVDAFCGTGAIYLKVLEEQRKDLTIVLNDKDSDIFNLYEKKWKVESGKWEVGS